jgi:hypothetical protein
MQHNSNINSNNYSDVKLERTRKFQKGQMGKSKFEIPQIPYVEETYRKKRMLRTQKFQKNQMGKCMIEARSIPFVAENSPRISRTQKFKNESTVTKRINGALHYALLLTLYEKTKSDDKNIFGVFYDSDSE